MRDSHAGLVGLRSAEPTFDLPSSSRPMLINQKTLAPACNGKAIPASCRARLHGFARSSDRAHHRWPSRRSCATSPSRQSSYPSAGAQASDAF